MSGRQWETSQRHRGNAAVSRASCWQGSARNRSRKQVNQPVNLSLPARQRLALHAGIIALAVLASATSLSNGFALDDLALVADNARVHSLHEWWRLFGLSYWPPQYGASLYRPIVTIGFAVQWVAGRGSPVVFHLTSIALYAGLSALVLAFLLELLGPIPAVIGAALFAV